MKKSYFGASQISNNDIVSPEIIQKIERFCAYQERCVFDVKKKLLSFQLSDNQINNIVSQLIDDNFINEERYVEIFVRSKINQSWGLQKIKSSLHSKQISDSLIEKYCSSISDNQYRQNIKNTIEKWFRAHPEASKNDPKLVRHLLAKGYYYGEILENLGE